METAVIIAASGYGVGIACGFLASYKTYVKQILKRIKK